MLMITTTTTDRTIIVIGNRLAMIAGKLMKTMIGKSHHRSILKATTTTSMSLQTSTNIPITQMTLKMATCALLMKSIPTLDIMMIIRIGTDDMSDMSVPLQFLFWKSILCESSR